MTRTSYDQVLTVYKQLSTIFKTKQIKHWNCIPFEHNGIMCSMFRELLVKLYPNDYKVVNSGPYLKLLRILKYSNAYISYEEYHMTYQLYPSYKLILILHKDFKLSYTKMYNYLIAEIFNHI